MDITGYFGLRTNSLYPDLFPPDICFTSDGGKLQVGQKSGETCIATDDLFEYTGDEKDTAARESAAALYDATIRGSLLPENIIVDKDDCTIKVVNFRLGWLGLSSPTLLDLSYANLSDDACLAAIDPFFEAAWSAGVFPSEYAVLDKKRELLEQHLTFRLFRDLRLDSQRQLSSYYLGLQLYDKAIETAAKIIANKLTVTSARPYGYDDAVYLTADARRIQGMRYWDASFMDKAVFFLADNYANLKAKEFGYMHRYNLELLRTCSSYRQNFIEVPAECRQNSVEVYATDATSTYNDYDPQYADNFIAVKSRLEHAQYRLVAADIDDLAAAEQEFDHVLADIASFRNPTGVLDHVAKFLRQALFSDQFKSDSFIIYEAQAYMGKAEIEKRRAEICVSKDDKLAHLAAARAIFEEHVLPLVQQIKLNAMHSFYSGGLYDERQTYFSAYTAYAENLYAIYLLTEGSDPPLEAAIYAAAFIVDEFYAHANGDLADVADFNYLKADYLLSRLNSDNYLARIESASAQLRKNASPGQMLVNAIGIYLDGRRQELAALSLNLEITADDVQAFENEALPLLSELNQIIQDLQAATDDYSKFSYHARVIQQRTLVNLLQLYREVEEVPDYTTIKQQLEDALGAQFVLDNDEQSVDKLFYTTAYLLSLDVSQQFLLLHAAPTVERNGIIISYSDPYNLTGGTSPSLDEIGPEWEEIDNAIAFAQSTDQPYLAAVARTTQVELLLAQAGQSLSSEEARTLARQAKQVLSDLR
ncbi:MAG: hypothetical protein QME05_06835, partial [Candidatus Margulisbacteria bacterium]|nr:hypothetical protein [Candidatus Margulisiibacteriota bacterium]